MNTNSKGIPIKVWNACVPKNQIISREEREYKLLIQEEEFLNKIEKQRKHEKSNVNKVDDIKHKKAKNEIKEEKSIRRNKIIAVVFIIVTILISI